MIMADLKTNYVDDVLDTTKNQLRKYQQIQNDDGTVSFVDVTEYTQVGTSFGAKDINDTNAAINYVNGKLTKKDFSNAVDLSSYSKNNKYIASDDGYVYFLAGRNYSGYVYVNDDVLAIGGDGDLAISLFIKKGMSLYFVRTDKNSGNYVGYAYFHPLI